MRTTLDLDDDVLAAARELARLESSSLGVAISRLAREGLRQRGVTPTGRIPHFRPRPNARPITSAAVAEALAEP